MKKILILIFVLTSGTLFAETNFSATLVKNGTYLSIHLSDDHFIPPFEAGELWSIVKGNDQIKLINEKEFTLNCQAFITPTHDTYGNCDLLIPFNLFVKMGNKMVFKADKAVAARLNRYFVDSAYLSMQRDEVYLSSYNTRRQFFFGINEDLIQR